MAYNYYTGSELLTNKAAVAPSSNSDYTYPKKSPFNMKLAEGGFLSADENIPNFITPYSTTKDYGYWGNLTEYKVAENQFYYKSGDNYIAYEFVDKYSAPILKKGNDNTNYTYNFEPFDIKDYSVDDTQSPPRYFYYKLSWDDSDDSATAKKIKLQTYDNRSTSPISTTSMSGYGCFILLSGGGGGGGGWYGGYGGGGGNGNTSDASSGAGGSVTARSAERSADGTITGSTSIGLTELPSYIKILTSISGGSGGRGGRDENGSPVEYTTYSIPFDFTWKTRTTVIGQGSSSLGSSGGGGASALSVNMAGYGQGGTGGTSTSTGQAGSGGRLIIFKNYFC